MKKRVAALLFLVICTFFCVTEVLAFTKTADNAKLMKEIKKVQASTAVKSHIKDLVRSVREFYRAVGNPAEDEETETEENTETETDYGEMQFGAIYGDVLKSWAKPIISETLKKTLVEAEILDKDGNLKDTGESQIEKTRDFVMTKLLPFKIETSQNGGNEYVPLNPNKGDALTVEVLDNMRELRLEVYKNAIADAYSLSLTSQYQLANFNQSILLPFKMELETSEDLQQRIKKNTWIVLALFSQINLDNILSVSGTRVQASSLLREQPTAFYEEELTDGTTGGN